MKEMIKKYSNDDITIVWKADLCIHSTKCWKGEKGLSSVFNPREKPWIKPEGADTKTIIAQIKQCPSGALSYYMNDEVAPEEIIQTNCIIEVSPNGPLIVKGEITVKDAAGQSTQKSNITAFCRCGASSNKPYCDGTHHKIGFTA